MQMIPGIGGSMFVASEKAGLRTNDECYKMAVTDALSVAMKMLGVGADIYMGRYDGSKYAEEKMLKAPILPTDGAWENVTDDEAADIRSCAEQVLHDLKHNLFEEAVHEIERWHFSNDQKIALWTCFDAPQRRKLKETYAKRSKRNTETQPAEDI